MQAVDVILPPDTAQSVDVILDGITSVATPDVIIDVILEGPPGPQGPPGSALPDVIDCGGPNDTNGA